MIEHKLQESGLSENEIKVYLYLLENGISTPLQIARGTRVTRTNTYPVLRNLKRLRLVEEQTQRKKKAFLASDPSALVSEMQRKKENIEEIVPDLQALYTRQKNKPKIKFYDGFEQVKTIYEATFTADEIYAIGSTEKLESVQKGLIEWYAKQVKKKAIIMHDILLDSARGKTGKQMKDIIGALYSVKFLPQKYQEIPTDMLIWNDNIALISLDEPIFGTVLTNKPLAITFKMLFELLWKREEV